MSHAYGMAKFEDGAVLHFEYNGTNDVVCTALRRTPEEVQKHWRADNKALCVRAKSPEPVQLMSDYGKGFHWPGTACRTCMAVVDGIFPDEVDEGWPDWATEAYKKNHHGTPEQPSP